LLKLTPFNYKPSKTNKDNDVIK